MGTKEAPRHMRGPPPSCMGAADPHAVPGGPCGLLQRSQAAILRLRVPSAPTHELSPDTCVRPGQWLALASRQHSSRGVGVTTAPSGVQCSKLCLPGHVGRSASWDSRGERSDREAGGGSLRNVEQRSGLLPGRRRSGTQVGDTGRGRASGPVFTQRGRCPRLCCPTRRETPARFREEAALPPARTRFVLWRLRCRARLVTPEFGFLTAPVLRNGGAPGRRGLTLGLLVG